MKTSIFGATTPSNVHMQKVRYFVEFGVSVITWEERRIWVGLQLEFNKKLCASVPRIIGAVLKAKGGYTKFWLICCLLLVDVKCVAVWCANCTPLTSAHVYFSMADLL